MESEGETAGKPMKNVGGQICQICSDNVGKTVDEDPFVACDFCSFPVCRPCYEYERKDGNQSCPQCKTTYKKHTVYQYLGRKLALETVESVSAGAEPSHLAAFGSLSQASPSSQFPAFLASS